MIAVPVETGEQATGAKVATKTIFQWMGTGGKAIGAGLIAAPELG